MKPFLTLLLLTSTSLLARAQAPVSPPAATPAPAATEAVAPAASQAAIVLKSGTLVVLETTALLSSKDAKQGQTIPLRVKYDVLISGRVAIKAGASASGQVTAAEHHKGLGKEGSLAIKPTVVQAVDGQMVPLVGAGTASAGSGTAGAAIGLAVVVSPLFLLHKGKEASIAAGYELQGTVANEAIIN